MAARYRQRRFGAARGVGEQRRPIGVNYRLIEQSADARGFAMEWENTPESSNVEDRRGNVSAGMGGGGASFGTGGMGIGVVVVVLIISYFTGINPAVLLGGAQILTGNGAGSSN